MLEQTKWAKQVLRECGVKSASVNSSLKTQRTQIVIFDTLEERLACAGKLGEHFSVSIGRYHGEPIVMVVRLPGIERDKDFTFEWKKGVSYWDVTGSEK